jgi:hypothetical protein
MNPVKPVPSRDELVKAVEAAGSADAPFFGYPKREDGLFLQQDPEEYAAFVHFMAARVPAADLTLEIGLASGGQTKFLRDYWAAKQTIVVDIGEHRDFPQWQRIKKDVNSDIVLEIIDDSHSGRVREKLLPFAGKVDFAFVDGDHSYRGLRKDIFLTKELLKPGALMALHDTTAAGDVHRVYQDMLYSRDFLLMRNFGNRFGISVWTFVGAKRLPNAFNRATGMGRV